MKCYKITRKEYPMCCEDYSMIAIAKDELHAERLARVSNEDFRKGELSIEEIDLNKEQIVMTLNAGE